MLQGVTGCYSRVLHGVIVGCYTVLQGLYGITRCYMVLQGVTGFLHGVTRGYRVLKNVTRC